MFLTKSGKATLDKNDAAARARAAGKAAQAAAKNAASAARAAAASAQASAQNAADKSQSAAQTAAEAAHNAAQKAQVATQLAAQKSAEVAQKSQAAAQSAAQKSAEIAQKSQAAAQNAGDSAQSTTATVTRQVRHGVFSARKWAAPKLEGVADYTTAKVAPSVSSALRSTAAQVRPAEPVSPAKRRMKSMLAWSLLGAAIAAAAGATAAVIRSQRRATGVVVSETPEGETPGSTVGTPAGQTGVVPAAAGQQPAKPVPGAKASPSGSANQTETATEASVNGHANTSAW